MANPLILLGTQPLPGPPPRPTDHKIVSATVSRIDAGNVFVTVQEFSGVYNFGPLETPEEWQPAVGDACLVAFDQNNVGHVVPAWDGAAAVEAEITSLQAKVLALEAPTVEALPASPREGQEVFFRNAAMAAEGVRWRLLYNGKSSASYKWEFVGGAPLAAGPGGAIEKTTKTQEALTGGPSLTVPLAGTYDVSLGLFAQQQAEGLQELKGWLAINGSPTYELYESIGYRTYEGAKTTNSARVELATSTVLTIHVENATEVKSDYSGGRLVLMPVRI